MNYIKWKNYTALKAFVACVLDHRHCWQFNWHLSIFALIVGAAAWSLFTKSWCHFLHSVSVLDEFCHSLSMCLTHHLVSFTISSLCCVFRLHWTTAFQVLILTSISYGSAEFDNRLFSFKRLPLKNLLLDYAMWKIPFTACVDLQHLFFALLIDMQCCESLLLQKMFSRRFSAGFFTTANSFVPLVTMASTFTALCKLSNNTVCKHSFRMQQLSL